ncbi:hypothetical protein SORBI_3003G128550 [Sorghum bicolor]|uniref:Uncharacterized protein n=1 Tax=Sorghum bicolor TaxID=4558 RepID=A0A1W0VX37_SORBI|nr:hypothetical protein SORBI_3003G128550 [Sorghum bicolor]
MEVYALEHMIEQVHNLDELGIPNFMCYFLPARDVRPRLPRHPLPDLLPFPILSARALPSARAPQSLRKRGARERPRRDRQRDPVLERRPPRRCPGSPRPHAVRAPAAGDLAVRETVAPSATESGPRAPPSARGRASSAARDLLVSAVLELPSARPPSSSAVCRESVVHTPPSATAAVRASPVLERRPRAVATAAMSTPVAVDASALVGKALPRIFTSTRPPPPPQVPCFGPSPRRPAVQPLAPRIHAYVTATPRTGARSSKGRLLASLAPRVGSLGRRWPRREQQPVESPSRGAAQAAGSRTLLLSRRPSSTPGHWPTLRRRAAPLAVAVEDPRELVPFRFACGHADVGTAASALDGALDPPAL